MANLAGEHQPLPDLLFRRALHARFFLTVGICLHEPDVSEQNLYSTILRRDLVAAINIMEILMQKQLHGVNILSCQALVCLKRRRIKHAL